MHVHVPSSDILMKRTFNRFSKVIFFPPKFVQKRYILEMVKSNLCKWGGGGTLIKLVTKISSNLYIKLTKI